MAVITKMDLAEVVEFSRETAERNIRAVRPGMEILETAAKTGRGMEAYIAFLEARLADARATAT